MEQPEQQPPEQPSPFQPIFDQLKENTTTLRINRIPWPAKQRFMRLAEQEFCSDYGMCLKWLLDGLPQGREAEILERLDIADQQITELRALISVPAAHSAPAPQAERGREITMLDGKTTIRGKSR